MNFSSDQDQFTCPSYEIASYLDGELDHVREMELEMHLAECRNCSEELKQQQQFMCGLSATLMNEGEIELPADFARHIIANAESTVAGLRRPRERYNALFICCGLFLFGLFALGTGTGNLLEGGANVYDQLAAVGGFFAHLVYSIFIGIAIVLRSLTAQFRVDVFMAIGMATVAVLLMLISRRLFRFIRT